MYLLTTSSTIPTESKYCNLLLRLLSPVSEHRQNAERRANNRWHARTKGRGRDGRTDSKREKGDPVRMGSRMESIRSGEKV